MSDMQYRIYKPLRAGNGAASKIEYTTKQRTRTGRDGNEVTFDVGMCFWESANQQGTGDDNNAKFGWTDDTQKVTLKLGLPDLSEILLVLRGVKPFAGPPPKNPNDRPKGLYHQTPNSNSSLSFNYDQERNDYVVRVSCKRNDNLVAITHRMTLAEGVVLQALIEKAIVNMISN